MTDLERANEITTKMVEGGTECNEWTVYDKDYLNMLVATALRKERERVIARVKKKVPKGRSFARNFLWEEGWDNCRDAVLSTLEDLK